MLTWQLHVLKDFMIAVSSSNAELEEGKEDGRTSAVFGGAKGQCEVSTCQ